LISLEENNIKHTEPNHPSHFKKKWSGWQAEQLRISNALDMVGLKKNDLKIAVHPIFHFNNFDRCPRSVHDVFSPALRLVSKFLAHPACARIPKLEEYSTEAASRELQLLKKNSNHVSIDFKSDLVLRNEDATLLHDARASCSNVLINICPQKRLTTIRNGRACFQRAPMKRSTR
jgi:hypothetical protein